MGHCVHVPPCSLRYTILRRGRVGCEGQYTLKPLQQQASASKPQGIFWDPLGFAFDGPRVKIACVSSKTHAKIIFQSSLMPGFNPALLSYMSTIINSPTLAGSRMSWCKSKCWWDITSSCNCLPLEKNEPAECFCNQYLGAQPVRINS